MTEKGNTEQFEVTLGNVVGKIMELIREGNVRRITLRRGGKTLLEVPLNAGLTVGAVTALVAPLLLGVGALAAVVTKVTVVVERPSKAERPASLDARPPRGMPKGCRRKSRRQPFGSRISGCWRGTAARRRSWCACSTTRSGCRHR